MRTKTIILIVLIALSVGLYSQEGTRAAIQGKSGNNWVLDKGTADGVAVGLKGYLWTSKKSGDKWYSLKIARFHVAKVEDKQCQVKVEDASEGFSEMEYQWATFMEILQAPEPKPRPPAPAPKAEKAVDNASRLEPLFWNSIKDGKSIDDFNEYLAKYPEGTFAGLARNRIQTLESEAAAARASDEQRLRQEEESRLAALQAQAKSKPKHARVARVELLASKVGIQKIKGPCDDAGNFVLNVAVSFGNKDFLLNINDKTFVKQEEQPYPCHLDAARIVKPPYEIIASVSEGFASTSRIVFLDGTPIKIDDRDHFYNPCWKWVDEKSFLFSNFGGLTAGQGGVWRIWIEED